MLQNRLYRGEVTHKGNSYPGEHPAIVEQATVGRSSGDACQEPRRAGNRAYAQSIRACSTGLVFDENGERLTPTYAVKKGTRYRYYVSTSLLTGAGRNRSSGRRIPAGNLEGLVINRLRAFLADPAAILDAVDDESHSGSGQSQLIERGRQIAEELEAQAPDEVKATLMTLAMPRGNQPRSHRNQYLPTPSCCVAHWAIDRSDDAGSEAGPWLR